MNRRQAKSVSPWMVTLVVYFACIAAAMQVGRIGPATVSLREEFTLSLAQLGWSVSLVTMASAVAGVLAGFWVITTGPRRALILGLMAMIGSVGVSAMSQWTEMLLAVRVLEGFGYLAIVVAAPTLVARHVRGSMLPRALSVWATFFTMGLFFGSLLGGWMASEFGWRLWFLANMFVLLAALLVVRGFLPQDESAVSRNQPLPRIIDRTLLPAWLLGFGFLGVTLISLAVLSLLPTYLVDRWEFLPARAGSVTALVAMASIVGSFLYGVLGNYQGRFRVLGVACLVMMAGAWPAFGGNAAIVGVIIGSAVVVGANGFLVAMVFASIPRLVTSVGAVGPANGLVAQVGSLGAVTGPPLMGFVVSGQGWGALVPLIIVFSTTALGLIIAAEHVRARVALA